MYNACFALRELFSSKADSIVASGVLLFSGHLALHLAQDNVIQ